MKRAFLTFLPLLAQMGVKVEIELLRPGFYPVGGGRISRQSTRLPLESFSWNA